MRLIPTLLATPCLLISCIPEGNAPQANHVSPSAPTPQTPSPYRTAPILAEERMQTQGERITRLENELHEMRLLFTNQLKRIEEVANRPAQLPASAYQSQQPPQQVVIMPNNPVVTHRWDQQAPRATASNHPRAYDVRSGDTLSQIAEAHGISTQALITSNPGVDPLRLQIGRRLTIPGAAQAAQFTAEARNRSRSYAVRSGDTLSQIAEAHGLGLSQLVAANPGLNPHRLRVGQQLTIPRVQTYQQPQARPQQLQRPQPSGYASPPLRSIQREPRISPQSNLQEPLQPHYQSHPLTPPPAAEPTHKTLIKIPKNTSFGEIAERVGTDIDTLNRLNHCALSATSRIPANGTLYVPAQP